MILIACGLGVATVAAAQESSSEDIVIYKWKQGNVTHYAKQPPRGGGGVIKLDKDGQVIGDEEADQMRFEAMRPKNRTTQAAPTEAVNTAVNTAQQSNEEGELPDGAITREQRCADAQIDLATLINTPSDKPINVEDSNGNLIPMSDADRQARLESTRALVERLCNN